MLLGWQNAARSAREGRLTESRSRQIIGEILERTTGENIAHDSVEGFLNAWLKGKEIASSTGTFVRYEHTVKLFLDSLRPNRSISLECVTPKHIERFRDTQLALGKASSSVNVDLKTLRTAFNLAKRRGSISVNPVDVIEFPNEQRNTRGTFSAEQIAALLSAASSEWQTAILLGYYIGARLGDAVSLTWENIDFTRGAISYRPQKTSKLLECPLHPDLERHLLSAVSIQNRSPKARLTPALAKMKIGGRSGLSRNFKQIMARAKIDDGRVEALGEQGRAFSVLSFHALRHTSVSAMANAGISPEIRMKVSGHTTESSHKTYTHLELDTLKKAISKLPSVTGRN